MLLSIKTYDMRYGWQRRKVNENMESRYPLFAGGRILKKEALWDLRDYAYESWQLFYEDYTDGIIKGCDVRVEGAKLIVGCGIMKYRDFIYFFGEEAVIPYTAENKPMLLKASFKKEEKNPDSLIYHVEFFLDSDLMLHENQIELCRFHLRSGSVLRDTYKNFYDMNTEYDTINLLHATMAGRGQERLHPKIVVRFVEELKQREEKHMADYAFSYQTDSMAGEIARETIISYLADKKRACEIEEMHRWDNVAIFHELTNVLGHDNNEGNSRTSRKVIYIE